MSVVYGSDVGVRGDDNIENWFEVKSLWVCGLEFLSNAFSGNVVLEKGGEDQLDRSCKRWR